MDPGDTGRKCGGMKYGKFCLSAEELIKDSKCQLQQCSCVRSIVPLKSNLPVRTAGDVQALLSPARKEQVVYHLLEGVQGLLIYSVPGWPQ
jgi:hypothetical protein